MATHGPRVVALADVSDALLISGVSGVGKSIVASAIARLLATDGRVFAVVDVDTLAQFGPAPWKRCDGVGFYDYLKCSNLGMIWDTFRAFGATHLVVAANVDTVEVRAAYERALSAQSMQVALLVAEPATIKSRLLGRPADPFHPNALAEDGTVRAEVLGATEANQARLRAAAVEDFTVVNDGAPIEAAHAVLERAGWSRYPRG